MRLTSRAWQWVRWLAGISLGLASVWGTTEMPYVNWRRTVSPLEGVPLLIRVDAKGSGLFGASRSGGRQHRGIDLEAPIGTPVRAIRSGVVRTVTWHRGLGHYIELRHAASLSSLYAHLDTTRVAEGERVRQGQIIGTVGKTGNARSPLIKAHLHMELAQAGAVVDPATWGIVAATASGTVDGQEAEGGD